MENNHIHFLLAYFESQLAVHSLTRTLIHEVELFVIDSRKEKKPRSFLCINKLFCRNKKTKVKKAQEIVMIVQEGGGMLTAYSTN